MTKPLTITELQNSLPEGLTLICETEKYTWTNKHGKVRSKRQFICKCSCGVEFKSSVEHLKSGHTTSCGCNQKKLASSANISHGRYKGVHNKPFSDLWVTLNQRCYNNEVYKRLQHDADLVDDYDSFAEYIINTLGDRPSEVHTLDRIDTNKGYVKGNIRWADKKTQSRNTRSRGGSSSYKGVCLHRGTGKYQANYHEDGVTFYLGIYENELDAAKQHVKKYLELHPEIENRDEDYWIMYFQS